MRIADHSVDRPVQATVLSLIIFIVGLIALPTLPIAEYPEVVPPSVVVTANYPGASPAVIADTVAAPLEQAVNGVENMLYMESRSTADGTMKLTVTMRLGSDPDLAQVQIQNRVNQALPKLPDDVRRLGVTTVKSASDLTLVVHLVATDGRYDPIYLRNFATLRVKDVLARLPGVGLVNVFGPGDYAMRVWLDPDRVAALGLSAGDVVRALREQNVQVAAGALGAPPAEQGQPLQLSIEAPGRLATEEEFARVVIRSGPGGELVRLGDVARIELGAASYALRSRLSGRDAIGIPVFQAPGSNALALSAAVRAAMDELARDFPEGVEHRIVYDPTVFVRESIAAVVSTLLEAVLLVVLVVIVFLQTWRASIIPLVAVPVSIVGTFAVMWLLGFSINTLTLFGLVLAIGIVVDDAIVVVENVERNVEAGLPPRAAALQAMREVSGPIIAVALVLCAVFVPVAFISGLTGQFHRQFAVTIAISTVISAVNSLTLSPALAALLLTARDAPRDWPTRLLDALLGWAFRLFDAGFRLGARAYARLVAALLAHRGLVLLAYLALVPLTAWLFVVTPTGFVPAQDKQYLVALARLPPAATLDRTAAVLDRMAAIALATPGVANTVQFPGLSIIGFTNAPNVGTMFMPLASFEERRTPELAGPAIAARLNQEFAAIDAAVVRAFTPPPVRGLGTIGGFKLQLLDQGEVGEGEMQRVVSEVIDRAAASPLLAPPFSSFELTVPRLDADIDRDRAKLLEVPLAELFETLQIYLGSLYVNDFNRFGRTYQVIVQADHAHRMAAEDVRALRVRAADGDMVPLDALIELREANGPDRVEHYNGIRSADVNGGPRPGVSTGEAQAEMERIVREVLPLGMGWQWTDLTYQQILAGDTALYVFPLCVLFVFLVLAAQYESFVLPLAIVLIVPMCLLSALAGVRIFGGDNDIFTQIGLIVLMGLACKNAILIVEFARDLELGGRSPAAAALEAARLRLRPILMTSIAFIAGVLPLVFSAGAGAEMRRAMGVAVASGMLGVTVFGLVLTPVFYVVLRRLFPGRLVGEAAFAGEAGEAGRAAAPQA